jgi:hypothetical protein
MIEITLKDRRTSFRPGDIIEGIAAWRLGVPLAEAELSLGWSTEGKGTVDHEIVETETWKDAPATGQRPFRFTAPAEPHSFDGHLISLRWRLDLLVNPGDENAHVEIIIAPEAAPIQLSRIEPAPGLHPSLLKPR